MLTPEKFLWHMLNSIFQHTYFPFVPTICFCSNLLRGPKLNSLKHMLFGSRILTQENELFKEDTSIMHLSALPFSNMSFNVKTNNREMSFFLFLLFMIMRKVVKTELPEFYHLMSGMTIEMVSQIK